MEKKDFNIILKEGLHARPAANLVQISNKFKSDIKLKYNNNIIDLKSIMSLMSLGILYKTKISIIINGIDEKKAMNEINFLLKKEGICK